ncbi:hypothetical protein [Spirochaeta isovalerica]|uniref:Thymidylate kinase n=1 Tax=Spirochaeta isovalerica TaxID=150 RepID=A0A841R903_9SPIO|nr:hypothetical protein [Spirochaeta isovalerica]MBB6479198.1 hypothetical protein [Spirochaeta isovalerica]
MSFDTWNVSGLILEGISGTGKTEILRAILQSERYRSRSGFSSYIMSEHQTQRVLEKKDREGGLSVRDNLSLLEEHLENISRLKSRLDAMEWCRKNQTAMRIPYILERFHFTHVYQYDHMSWKDVVPIDGKLLDLNCRAVVLTAERDKLADRILSGRDAMWMNYIKGFGDSDEKIIDHFERQQEELKELAEQSDLDIRFFDTGLNPPEQTAGEILDFWGAF